MKNPQRYFLLALFTYWSQPMEASATDRYARDVVRASQLQRSLTPATILNPNAIHESGEEINKIPVDAVDRTQTQWLLTDVQTSTAICSRTIATLRPVDCSDLRLMGHAKSGVYEIFPFKCQCTGPVKVWCDMETDGGGWTVFLYRQSKTRNPSGFHRSWAQYREGFGNATDEYWIGNQNLHIMTNTRVYTMRLDFVEKNGITRWAEWPKFFVGNEESKYKLSIPEFNDRSTFPNCMKHQHARTFSTYENDYDSVGNRNCAADNQGGFWYFNCVGLNPTAKFNPEGYIKTPCKYRNGGKLEALLGIGLQLKIRPQICGQPVKTIDLTTYNCN